MCNANPHRLCAKCPRHAFKEDKGQFVHNRVRAECIVFGKFHHLSIDSLCIPVIKKETIYEQVNQLKISTCIPDNGQVGRAFSFDKYASF